MLKYNSFVKIRRENKKGQALKLGPLVSSHWSHTAKTFRFNHFRCLTDLLLSCCEGSGDTGNFPLYPQQLAEG